MSTTTSYYFAFLIKLPFGLRGDVEPWLMAFGLRGGVEPWLMARWKALVEFLLSVIELLFLSLTAEALQGKMYQNSLSSGAVGHLEPSFQGEGVIPLAIY